MTSPSGPARSEVAVSAPLRIDGTELRGVRTPMFGLPDGLLEPRRGYRFRPENRAVVDFVRHVADEAGGLSRVVDLGAGCGVLGLAAGVAVGAREVVLVEQDPDLVAFARHNAAAAPVEARVAVDDLRGLSADEVGPVDLVVANPPFFEPNEGRSSDKEMVRNATHAHHGGVTEFVACAARLLDGGGAALVVYPADRLAGVLEAVTDVGLSPRRLLVLYARHTGRPFRVWLHASTTTGPLDVFRASTWTARPGARRTRVAVS